jgi:hypothetical protein
MYLGLSGLKNRMRVRESFENSVGPAVIGVHGARNRKTGEVLVGNDVVQTVGTHIDRVSIDESHGRPPYRVGGPLCLYRLIRPTYVAGQASIIGRQLPAGHVLHGSGKTITVKANDGWALTYDGGFTKSLIGFQQDLGSAETYRPSSFDSRDPMLDPDDLSDLGNRAYGNLRPKIEKANLAQSFAEMGGVVPMLKTSAKGFHDLWKTVSGGYAGGRLQPLKDRNRANRPWTMSPKGAGDQFLNYQFGWSPFLQDIASVASTVANLETHVANAMGNNGHWQNRRFHEDIVESEQLIHSQTGVSNNMCTPTLSNQWVVQPHTGSFTIVLRQVTRIWYEGSFKRYRPEFDPSLTRGHPALKALEQALVLNGLRVNPTTVYRCIPYTWLADYLGSFSQGIQRLEDSLSGEMVCRRFHLMRSTFKRYEYRVQFATFDGQAHDITWVKEASVKRRANGENAFGFSASPGGLTGMQYAILGALGASRTRW